MLNKGKNFSVLLLICFSLLSDPKILASDHEKRINAILDIDSIIKYPHPGTIWLLQPILRSKEKNLRFDQDNLDNLLKRSQSRKKNQKILKKAANMAIVGGILAKDAETRDALMSQAIEILRSLKKPKKNKKVNADLEITISIVNWLKNNAEPDFSRGKFWSKFASKDLKSRIFLVRYLSRAIKDNNSKYRKTIMKMAKKSGPRDAAIYYVSAGTIFSGYDFWGNKVGSADRIMQAWTRVSANKIKDYEGGVNFVDSQDLLSWVFINWHRSKLKFFPKVTLPESYSDTKMVILEQQSLGFVKSKKIKSGIYSYHVIAEGLKAAGDKTKLKLVESRIIELAKDYPPSGQFIVDYNQMMKRYSSQPAIAQSLTKEWLSVIDLLSKKAISQDEKKQKFAKSSFNWIVRSRKYLSITELRTVVDATTPLYEKLGYYKEAVLAWSFLFKFPKQLQDATKQAIKYQSIIAKWPLKPSFKIYKPILAKHRKRLYKFYLISGSKNKEVNWSLESQKGLLAINAIGIDKGFSLWFPLLRNKFSNQPLGLSMAGYLAKKLDEKAQWDNYIALCRTIKAKQIKPIYYDKPYKWRKSFANALVSRGEKHFLAKKYGLAAIDLEEFTVDFVNDPRREKALFLLGKSYVNSKNSSKGLASIVTMVETYPKGKYFYQGLLYGADVAEKSKSEKDFITLLERFNKVFPNDSKAVVVRKRLVKFYLRKQFYGEALILLRQQSTNKMVPSKEQINAALEYIRIEESYGDRARAFSAVQRILAIPQSSQRDKAKAYGLMARVASDQDELATLTMIEKKLSSWDKNDAAVQDTLSFVRFMIARENVNYSYAKSNNLKIRDPIPVIDAYIKDWINKRRYLDPVCVNGNGSFCGPSLLRLWQITQLAIIEIQKLTLPQSLSSEEIESFNSTKQKKMQPLSDFAEEALDKAVRLTENGRVPSEWKDLILSVENDDIAPETIPETVDFTIEY